ncbi:hypothetical protein [Sphingomonas jaspsi]|uniref:hypothetical protein n=1 Tax=Sphingomonas jaspsi TaxID=392409 RepID=UPI0004AC9274|nr:hypothetical protein [Sphingomonas jaspsi]
MTEEEMLARWDQAKRVYAQRWVWLLLAIWLLYVAFMIWHKMPAINALALGDTDDNLRLAEVRAWLNGQGWFDLRQHRFDPLHGGANIHWSRLVDLPIAGLILLLKPMIGTAAAERWASGLAPLLPLSLLAFSLALTVRRLVGEKAWVLPLLGLVSAYSTIGMFSPLRIDHHGWQLAFLSLAIAGMADPRKARGGAVMGLATGLSLIVGLEMLIYLALLGGAAVLMWVAERDERRRMTAYAATLAASTGLGYLLFASEANRLPVCDALSPVWLSDAAVGAAVMVALSYLRFDGWKSRLVAAAVAGVGVAAFHALSWPHCLQRLEGVSQEATDLWLNRVKEARPFYRFDWRTASITVAFPAIGLVGWALLVRNAWKLGAEGRDLLRRMLAIALPAVAGLGLLAWQMRAAPAAQMMALPAAAGLVVLVGNALLNAEKLLTRLIGVIVITLSLGALVPVVINALPQKADKPIQKRVGAANRNCTSAKALAPLDRLPKGLVFSFVDLGPRLIVMTHHDAVGGPYHRNYNAIVDVMKAFRGDEAQARRIVDYYGSDYLLICPDMATATLFTTETPKGFYSQLVGGKVPAWLQPVDLGKDSPFRMWKVVR